MNVLYYRYLTMLSTKSRHPGSFSRAGLEYLLINRYAKQQHASSYVEITESGRAILKVWIAQYGSIEEKAGYIE